MCGGVGTAWQMALRFVPGQDAEEEGEEGARSGQWVWFFDVRQRSRQRVDRGGVFVVVRKQPGQQHSASSVAPAFIGVNGGGEQEKSQSGRRQR